jgi:hypothetical protein
MFLRRNEPNRAALTLKTELAGPLEYFNQFGVTVRAPGQMRAYESE